MGAIDKDNSLKKLQLMANIGKYFATIFTEKQHNTSLCFR